MRSLAVFTFLAGALWAQAKRDPGPIPSYQVRRAGPVKVDGKLDEAAWKAAGVIEFQFPWKEQTGAMQKTRARLLWDDQFLYVGYDCDDTEVLAQYTRRDDPTYKDDAVEIFINPDPSQSLYYGLEMNARATLFDYFYVFPKFLLKRFNMDGVALQTSRRPKGWSLEVAIPWPNFEDLTKKLPPPPGTTWTANLNRWDGVAPNRRLSQWSDSGLEAPNPHNPQRFGKLVFVQ